MGIKPILSAEEAAFLVEDGMTVTASGFVASVLPEMLTGALESRFLKTGSPKNLTLFYAAAQGNRDGSGADHFAHPGMLKRVIGGHYNMVPKIGKMILDNEIEAYNFPQGTLSQLYRDIAAHKPGTITHVGIGTFADPRVEGGKLNKRTKEDMVEVIDILGEEKLIYKAIPLNIAFLRGSLADPYGNVTLEHEAGPLESTSVAQAVHNSGGKVIVQVERIVSPGQLDPRMVIIPGIYVDGLVVSGGKDHEQFVGWEYDPSISGETRVPVEGLERDQLCTKKIIARRAAMELEKNSVVNLGIGIPEYIAQVANEEKIGDYMTLTVENGPIGGIPLGGSRFGGSINPQAILDQPYQFDFYDGGGADFAFLGLAQTDRRGNINVSKFGPRIAGCGGFINITQNAKKVFFCGTFTAGGLDIGFDNGKIRILQEGKTKKFVKEVEQITFSADYARRTNQPVQYITERAVFELRSDGLYLTEIAPGVDLQTQVLDQMEFKPKIDENLKLMDLRLFRDEPMGLA